MLLGVLLVGRLLPNYIINTLFIFILLSLENNSYPKSYPEQNNL